MDPQDGPILQWVDSKANEIVTQVGKGVGTTLGRFYHIPRHPVAAINRVLSRATWKKTYINLIKILALLLPLVVTKLISLPVLKIASIYDNNLSSAQLRTKGSLRRLAGWLFRHRFNALAGPDRGSVQNTNMLLNEYAALPVNTDPELEAIYREELEDMLERWHVGSEDPNPELQTRVEKALAQS
jgi:hypothetical protein